MTVGISDIREALGEFPSDDLVEVEFVHVSKHRRGHAKPLSAKERKRSRARRMKEVRKRISDTLDAKAIREAVDGPGA